MRVLLVEDDAVSRKTLTAILAKFGAECDLAEDGEDALVAFTSAILTNVPYDLICLDLMMPGVDGLATMRSIRGYESSRSLSKENSVKILVTTSLDMSIEGLGKFKNACEGYLVKPIDSANVRKHLEELKLIPAK